MHPMVADLADPVVEQVVELVQAGDRVPGRVISAGGHFDQELLLDSLEYFFDLATAGRFPWLTVGQLDAQHRAGARQRGVGEAAAVVGIQDGRRAVALHGRPQHAGEPDRVRAADELVPGQEPGMIVDDAGQVTGPPASIGAVHQVRGPDLVHLRRLEPAVCLRRLAAGAGGQLAGLEPALDRPLGRGPAQLRGQHPPHLGGGAGRVLPLQPHRQVHHLRAGARRALPRRRHQRIKPAHPARGDPTADRLAGHAHRAPPRAGVLTGGQSPHDRPALARGQGSIHRRLDQRPPPQRDRLRPLPPGRRFPVRLCHAFLPEIAVTGLTATLPGPAGRQEGVTAAIAIRVVLPARAGSGGASSMPPVRCAATS